MPVMLGRWKYVDTAETLAPGPSHLLLAVATAKLKKHKLLGSDQIPEN
jgi:hypothetical protein